MGFLSSFGSKKKSKKSNGKVPDTSNKATMSNPERGGLGKFVDDERIEKQKPVEPQSSKDFFSNPQTKFTDPELTIRPPSAPLFAPIEKKETKEEPKSTMLPKDFTAPKMQQNPEPETPAPLFTEKAAPNPASTRLPEMPSTMLPQNNTAQEEDDYEPVFLFGGAPKPINQQRPQPLKEVSSNNQGTSNLFAQNKEPAEQDFFPTKAEKTNAPQLNDDISNVQDFLTNNPSNDIKKDVAQVSKTVPNVQAAPPSFNNNQTPKIDIFRQLDDGDTEDAQPISLFFKESQKVEAPEVPEDIDSIINRKLEEIRVLSEKYK